MNKDHLLPALCKALGIDTHEHHAVVGIDKPAIKAKMRELKAKRDSALESGITINSRASAARSTVSIVRFGRTSRPSTHVEEVHRGRFSSHTHGTFSWPELATTDQKGAVAFYRALFGWDLNDQPMGPTETYSMFQMRGKEVGAAYTMRPEERQHGAPPHWNSYVTVKNVDEAVKKAEGLGAKVFAPPFDVMDAGRMAVLQDPTGAVFQVWQPNKHIGAKILNEPARSAGQSSRPPIPRPPRSSIPRCLAGRRSTVQPARRWNTRNSASPGRRASA
jgi:predicted enzyme related to lactoylglutathione lyase